MTGGAAQWPADQLPRPPEVCPEPEDSFKLQLALSETKVQSIREQLAGNSRKDAEAAELARRDSAKPLDAATGCGHGSRPATTALEPPQLETRLSEALAPAVGIDEARPHGWYLTQMRALLAYRGGDGTQGGAG